MTLTMSDIEDRLKTVEDNTNEILNLLKSNPDFNKKGLVENVNNLMEDMDDIQLREKLFKTRLLAYASALTFFTGMIIWLGDKLFNLIFTE